MVVIIPAYQPDDKLIKLVADLRAKTDYDILIVDDGSSADKQPIFAALEGNAVVLHHEVNRGKGRALKTALQYIRENCADAEGVVTIDADGQHLVADIMRVCEDWKKNPNALVLGSRRFTGDVPFKSRTGNAITRFVFAVSTGVRVFDTQTGLRAFSVRRIPMMLEMKGDRYEYEINVLLYATKHQIPIREVTIETVYIEDNASSHFHPVRDAWRIYSMIFLFIGSSVLSFLTDYVAFNLIFKLGLGLLLSDVIARVISSLVNYLINRKFVFEGKGFWSALRYYVLAVVILAADYGILYLLTTVLPVPEFAGKLVAGVILYPISFVLQRKFVFPSKKED